MSVQNIHPQTPLLFRKTGVCRGIPIFAKNIAYGYTLEKIFSRTFLIFFLFLLKT